MKKGGTDLSKSSKIARRNRRRERRREDRLDTKNTYGFTDYTPYNAITGNHIMSRATLSNAKQKVYGSFNG